MAKTSGYIKTIEALDIGVSSMRLGGGRATIEDVIDMSAGIVLNKKVGDKVEKNDVLCYLHTNKDDKEIASIIGDVEKAFVIVPEFVAKHKVILEIIE